MMEIKIEKNVVMPENAKAAKYPFSQLEIGDSFQVPAQFVMSARVSMNTCQKASSGVKKFSSRKNGENTRFWRVR